MSEVTFTPEQIREIRRRIEHLRPHPLQPDGFRHSVVNATVDMALAAFPLPKVTRYRTFTVTWAYLQDSKVEMYRVNHGRVEYFSVDGEWYRTNYGDGTVASFAEQLVAKKRWTALAAFADVCARPTEEVDA